MLSREEREKLGWVGKVEFTNVETGETEILDFDPDPDDDLADCCTVFSPEEWDELMKRQTHSDDNDNAE